MDTNRKTTGKLRNIMLLLLSCIVVLTAAFFILGINHKIEVYNLLTNYFNNNKYGMELSVMADMGQGGSVTKMNIAFDELEGNRIICADLYDIPVYYYDGMIILDDGSAYKAGNDSLDFSELSSNVIKVVSLLKSSVSKEGEEKVYSFSFNKEKLSMFDEVFLSAGITDIFIIEDVKLNIIAKEKKFDKLVLSVSGTMTDTDLPVKITVDIKNIDNYKAVSIPQGIKDMILLGNIDAKEVFSEEMINLFIALIKLNARNDFRADIGLKLDCSIITLNEEWDMYKTYTEDMNIICIEKDRDAIYFSGNRGCDEAGNILSTSDSGMESANLLKAAYYLCFSGEVECTEENGNYIYSLEIDEDMIESVIYTIVPELEAAEVSFSPGEIDITVSAGEIKSLSFECGGSINVIFIDIPVELSGEMIFATDRDNNNITIPDEVINALRIPEI